MNVFVKQADTYKVTVLLLEDGIVGYQADYESGDKQDYHHDNIARMAVTDIRGESFTTTTDKQIYSNQYSLELPAKYEQENMRILVYVQRAYGKVSKIKDSDYDDYFVDNCASGKAGESKSPAVYADDGSK